MLTSATTESHTARSTGRYLAGVSVVALTAVVLVAIGVLLAVLCLPEPVPSSLQGGESSGSSVSVSSHLFDGAHQVAVSLKTDQGFVLRSGASGVVTSTSCLIGGVLSSGQPLLSVNGVQVIGLATPEPLWRDLSVDAQNPDAPVLQGSDVLGLQTELVRLGYKVRESGAFDSATMAAVKKLLKAAGGTSPDGSLLLSRVVWLPSPQVTVSVCPVGVGDTVSVGDALAQAGGGLASLTVANPPGDGWVVAYDGMSSAIDSNGVVTDAAFLSDLEGGPEYQYFAANPGSGQLQLTLRLAAPLVVLAVPPSAVVVTGLGTGCVVSGGQVVPVKIVSSSLGQTMVQVASDAQVSSVLVQPDAATRCS